MSHRAERKAANRRSARVGQPAARIGSESSIVVLDRFIQATRDSGYKGTASAISELVDNSIQAGATRISISLASSPTDGSITISTIDNGCGMDPTTLRQSLRFGGSTRFGYRNGLGRYGMGLPNSSLSQARRLVVYTWQGAGPRRSSSLRDVRVYRSYLDVDEIVAGEMKEIPEPILTESADVPVTTRSGTGVIWERCDRLDYRRISTLVRKLHIDLARRFRHFLWKGLRVDINGEKVAAYDPLFVHQSAQVSGARLFGDPLVYEVCANPANPGITGRVEVRFSELPVESWYCLSNEEKRRRGVSKGSGISIVRAGREVDFGWFFMGSKHRENYDDWWRCEIQFDPVLDEAFGITHTKQQVRPQVHLLESLSSDLEATARALNARARKAHLAAKTRNVFSEAENVASARDHLLRPLPARVPAQARAVMRELKKSFPSLSSTPKSGTTGSRYRIIEDAREDTCFYTCAFDGHQLVLVLNPAHPFYREIYKPLAEGEALRNPPLRAKIELLLLAAARSEVVSQGERAVARHRRDWSNTLATFLNN
jgi:Histidine kinase-, DNA gyrase B-, and HSP90-like ATPase